MTELDVPDQRVRSGPAPWPAPVAVPVVVVAEALLGIAAIVPVTQTRILATGIATYFGRYSTKNWFEDGAEVVWILWAISWAVYLTVVLLVTRALARRWPWSRRGLVLLCAVLLLAPPVWVFAISGLLLP